MLGRTLRQSFLMCVTAAGVAAAFVGMDAHARGDLAQPGPYLAGTKSVTVTRSNGSTFPATLFYPALVAGSNAPFDPAAAPCHGITFGHGFLQPVTQYTSTLSHLATHGFIVIAPQSEGGLLPNHANFAKDLRFSLDWLVQQNALESSPFFGAIAVDAFGASGHSMGGGAAILATKDDPRIKALAPTAPADTSPSSISAISAVQSPVRLIVGSQDSIVPPGSSAVPMYANAPGPRQLLSIQGGFHCGFTDANVVFCDSGSITRAQQLAITRRLLAEFFLLHLHGDQSQWPAVWGPEIPSPLETAVTRDPRLTISIVPDAIAVPPGGTAMVTISVTNTGSISTGVDLLTESADGWIAVPVAGSTLALAPGASASAVYQVTPVLRATNGTVRVSARRTADGATRTFTDLAVVLAPSLADLNGDGVVNGTDLAIVLGAWGPCQRVPCPADLTGDGAVDGADLAVLLGQWS